MKAALLRTPAPLASRPLALADVPLPTLADDEVLVRVRACGICRTDLHVVEGELPVRKSPVVPGHQVVGEVVAAGPRAGRTPGPSRVGVAWLQRTCGVCRFCASGRENLCESPAFTGWTEDGGFAEYVKAPGAFVYDLPDGFGDLDAAPLLCAGIIGYRCLRMTGLDAPGRSWKGARLGLYGFGAAAHVAIQLARARGADVYAFSRVKDASQDLARELGAAWVGISTERPPVALDAAIVFAPAGELVPPGLAALDKGGTLVLGGIHMSAIPSFSYDLLYGERIVRSVANNTREDGHALLREAAAIGLRTEVTTFPLDRVNEGLLALKEGAYAGAGVVVVGGAG